MASQGEFYKILQVSNDATLDEIKAAHRRLILQYHPDKSGKSGTGESEEFRKVREAYEVLSDPARRIQYDNSIVNGEEELWDEISLSSSHGDDRKKAAMRVHEANVVELVSRVSDTNCALGALRTYYTGLGPPFYEQAVGGLLEEVAGGTRCVRSCPICLPWCHEHIW